MKTINLKNGKTLETEYKNCNILALGSIFELRNIKGEYCLFTKKASQELANYFNAPINGKETALRVEKNIYDELNQELVNMKKEAKKIEEEKRNNFIATRPQKKVLMFSGWYLSNPAEIVILFEDENKTWYVAERHNIITEIQPKDAIDNNLVEVDIKTGFESRCFEINDSQTEMILNICKERKTEKENIEKAKIEKEEQKKNVLIEKAKKEGKRQEYSRYTTDCDGSVDECSTDIIIQYITQEGLFEYERIHTY